MNIVFLDSSSLPSPLERPAVALDWDERPATSSDELVAALSGAQVAVTNKVKITRAALEQLPELKFICVAATGYDCIDLAACRDMGVTVSNVPAYSAVSVAEAVIGSIFVLRRHLLAYRQAAVEHWPSSAHFCVHGKPVLDVEGTTLGIFGRGDIGSRVARLAKALGMNVLFAEHRGATTVRSGYHAFERVLEQAEILTLHCPLTPQTHHLIGEPEIARIKSGAILINTARGPLVDESAVLRGLQSGKLGGAALDVLAVEPPPATHPLLNFEHSGLLITPHVGWASQTSVERLKTVILKNIAAYAEARPINVGS